MKVRSRAPRPQIAPDVRSLLPRKKIVVGMPAYNEESYVGSVVLQARQFADEVIVVDDGSRDRTARIAEMAGASVVRHPRNQGYGAAIRTLLDEGKKRDVDVLVVIDADSQHNPDEIPQFIKAIADGYDVAVGSRVAQSKDIPYYRHLGQRVLGFFARVLSGSRLSDTECGFRAYSRKALEMLKPRETGMAIAAEIISEATARGLAIREVSVSAIYTRDGSTLNPVRHGMGNLQRILYMISERRPLLFFGTGGGVLLLLGLAAGVAVTRSFYTNYVLATGTALISMLLVTVGVLCIFTGLILDVLIRRVKTPRDQGV